ncbi:MAG TPA: penicillin-binding protein 2 [Acidobacteriota bacterium]|nr:penicillin-binding protein 2 [Acidobacteriota bacterium]
MPINQDNRPLNRRLAILQVVFGLVLLLLLGKLWHLSVVHYSFYEELAHNNRVRTVPLVAPRGLILDREGRVLADNVPSSKLLVYRDELDDEEATYAFIARGLGLSPSQVRESVEKASRRVGRFRPLEVTGSLSLEQVAYFKARQAEHPEVRISRQPRRLYRHGPLAAHVLGYVGEINEAQLGSKEFQGFKPGDVIGKFGLERQYNRLLSGKDGSALVRVNSQGKATAEISRQEPTRGSPLHITLDLDLQMAAEEALSQEIGAVVALDPRNGEVLAMASSPAYDPNGFARGLSAEEWEELNNPGKPLQNRAIQNAYSPGSIFKVVMAAAGLRSGVYSLDTTVYCNGGATIYGHRFRCHHSGGHGRVGLELAIERSCNVYFYQMGRQMPIDQIHHYASQFGLGRATGIDLPGEVSGLLPSTRWKREARDQPWYPGETISVSIGQGPINVTPLQLASAIGVAATGRAPRPHLALRSGAGEVSSQAAPNLLEDFDPRHIEGIRQGMWRAVNNWGTARAARVEGFDVAGKTGTAQVIGRETLEKLSKEEAARFTTNAWFAGFAPRDNPEVVVVALVQQGGGGGAKAAPIAGKLFDLYYRKHHLHEPMQSPVELR